MAAYRERLPGGPSRESLAAGSGLLASVFLLELSTDPPIRLGSDSLAETSSEGRSFEAFFNRQQGHLQRPIASNPATR